MKQPFFYISVFIFIIPVLLVAQNDGVLKPVQVRPPNPGKALQKEESDEQLAAQFFRNKEFEKAVVLYEKLYLQKSSSLYYTYYLYCLLELERFRDAEKLAKKQIRSYPERLKYLVDLGYIYSEEGQKNKAKKQFEEAIKSLAPDKRMIIELSNAFLYRGQTDYAIEVYQKGGRIMDYPFYIELGNLYRQVGNYAQMVEVYLDAVDYDYFNITTVQSRLQTILEDDPDGKISEYVRVSLLTRVQKNPQKLYFSEMLLWLSIQNEDFEMAFIQAKSIDKRNNEDGSRIFDLAQISISNANYDVAIDAYKYILKKGKGTVFYLDAKIGLLYAHYLKITESFDYTDDDLRVLEKDYVSTLDEFGRNASTILIMKYLAHLQAFYLEKPDDARDIMQMAIHIPNADQRNIAECKIELADILLLIGDVWEAKLLYAQVEKSFKLDPLGYEAKFKNARLSFYLGEYDWAKAQLDVLKAATSKLIANDALKLSVLITDNMDADSSGIALGLYAQADLAVYQNNVEGALNLLDSIFTLSTYHPIFDEVYLKKAEIKIRERQFEQAIGYLKEIEENYAYDITADDALFQMAVIYDTYYGDTDKAKEYYQKLLNEYTGSLYVVDARKRFRILRGDAITKEAEIEELFFYDIRN